MEWYRRWTDRRSSAQLYQAGFWGTVVFDAICDISAERDFGGVIPEAYCEGSFLVRQLNLEPSDCGAGDGVDSRENVVTFALAKLLKVGLVRRDEDSIIIDGWDRRQPRLPKKSTERVRKYREALKKKTETETKQDETRFTSFQGVSETHETHNEKEKEKEKEKKREKKKNTVADAIGEKGRTQQLTAQLVEVYREARGSAYLHQGAKDGVALKQLLAIASDAELLTRWRRGLKATGWHQVSTLAQLRSKWNDLAQSVQTTGSEAKRPRPLSTAEALEKSLKEAKPLLPLKERNPKLWAENEARLAAQREEEKKKQEEWARYDMESNLKRQGGE